MSFPPIPLSTLAAEGELQVSKFQKIALLLDGFEIEHFLRFLSSSKEDPFLIATNGKCTIDEAMIPFERFIADYREYAELLKKGALPSYEHFSLKFSNLLTLEPTNLYAIPLSAGRVLIKPKTPVIQMQSNHLQYSKEDGSFRTQVYGKGSITWGFLLSYPQLFQSRTTYAIEPVREGFINTLLFHKIKRWVRDFTLPTRFLVDGKRSATNIRLGKKCDWINAHPQLIREKISVLFGKE